MNTKQQVHLQMQTIA